MPVQTEDFDLEEAFVLVQSPPEYHDGLLFLYPHLDDDGVDDDEGHPLDRVVNLPTFTLGVRLDPVVVKLLDAVASTYRMSRSDLVRRFLQVSLQRFPGQFDRVFTEFRGEGVEPLRKPNAVGTGSAATPGKPKSRGGR